MATDIEVTDPQLSVYVPVPKDGDGVCSICHGASTRGRMGTFYPTCYSCSRIPRLGVKTIVPISLVTTDGSQLYTALRDYKSSSIDHAVRAKHSLLIAATLQRFLREHGRCISTAAGEEWNVITVVPSTRRLTGPHPLETAIVRIAQALSPQYRHLLSGTGEGVPRNEVNDAAFVVADDEPLDDLRVLLIDDTYTSGAHIQSAAVALTKAGASVVGAVAVGRVVGTHDDRYPEKEEMWTRQRRIRFSFNDCCLE